MPDNTVTATAADRAKHLQSRLGRALLDEIPDKGAKIFEVDWEGVLPHPLVDELLSERAVELRDNLTEQEVASYMAARLDLSGTLNHNDD